MPQRVRHRQWIDIVIRVLSHRLTRARPHRLARRSAQQTPPRVRARARPLPRTPAARPGKGTSRVPGTRGVSSRSEQPGRRGLCIAHLVEREEDDRVPLRAARELAQPDHQRERADGVGVAPLVQQPLLGVLPHAQAAPAAADQPAALRQHQQLAHAPAVRRKRLQGLRAARARARGEERREGRRAKRAVGALACEPSRRGCAVCGACMCCSPSARASPTRARCRPPSPRAESCRRARAR